MGSTGSIVPAWLAAWLTVAGYVSFGGVVVLFVLRMAALKRHFNSNTLRGHLFPSFRERLHFMLPWVLKTGDARLDRLSRLYAISLILFVTLMLLTVVVADSGPGVGGGTVSQ